MTYIYNSYVYEALIGITRKNMRKLKVKFNSPKYSYFKEQVPIKDFLSLSPEDSSFFTTTLYQ